MFFFLRKRKEGYEIQCLDKCQLVSHTFFASNVEAREKRSQYMNFQIANSLRGARRLSVIGLRIIRIYVHVVKLFILYQERRINLKKRPIAID